MAALQLKRKFIGIELDKNFYTISEERLKNTIPEMVETNWNDL